MPVPETRCRSNPRTEMETATYKSPSLPSLDGPVSTPLGVEGLSGFLEGLNGSLETDVVRTTSTETQSIFRLGDRDRGTRRVSRPRERSPTQTRTSGIRQWRSQSTGVPGRDVTTKV